MQKTISFKNNLIIYNCNISMEELNKCFDWYNKHLANIFLQGSSAEKHKINILKCNNIPIIVCECGETVAISE